MTPEEVKVWLQGVLDAKVASGEPMTVEDLTWIRRALDCSIIRHQYDPMPVQKETRCVRTC